MKKSFLLLLLMTLLPLATWAQGDQIVVDPQPAEPTPVAQIGETTYLNLQDAIDAVTTGQTIELLTDIEYTTETVALGGSDAVGVTTPTSYTIDLAGNNISFSAYPNDASAITLGRSGLAVTITNSAAAGGLISGENDGEPDPLIRVGNDNVDGSSLTIESGVTVTNKKAATILVVSKSETISLNVLNVYGTVTCESFWDFAVGTNGANIGGIINVFDGAVVTGSGEGIYQNETVQGGIAIYIPAGECNIEGGTITGYDAGVGVKSGVLNISGGTIICEAPKGDYPWEWNANGVNGVGHAVQVENGDYPGGAPRVSITGGKFVSNNDAVGSYFYPDGADAALGMFIKGGNYTDNKLNGVLAEGYEAVLAQDGETYDVETVEKTLVQVVPQSGITMEYHGAIDLTNPDVISLTPLQLNAIEGLREAILTKLQVNNAEALAAREQLGATQYSLGLIDENDKKVTFDNQTYTIMPLSSADVVIIPAKNKFNEDANGELLLPALAENLEYTAEARALVAEPTDGQTAFPGVEFVVVDKEVDALVEEPTTGWAAYDADANKRTNVGTYYVWARPAADATDGKYEAGDAVLLGEVEIAKATPELAGMMALTNAGEVSPVAGNDKIAGNYTCTYAPNLVITASGVTANPTFANGSVKYYYAKRNNDETWGAKTAFVVDNPETQDVNEATTFGAGTYKITAEIAADESEYGNWAAATDEAYTITLTVNKANAFTDETKPSARDLTYNGTAQELVEVGEGVPADVIQYRVRINNNWTSWSATIPTRTNAGTYTVQYRVWDDNYNRVGSNGNYPSVTTTIKKSLLAIKVNDVTKVYDATNTVNKNNTTTVEKDGDRFTLLNETFRDGADAGQILSVNYAALAANTGITVAGGPYEITVSKDALTSLNANYDYEVIPGTLTITSAEIYVQTQRYPVLPNGNNNYGIDRYTTTYGVAIDFSKTYVVHGLKGNDTAEDAFETLPVLTAPTALPADNPEVGEYDFVFTPGVLKANGNYKMRAENPYYVWTDGTNTDHFTVNPVADSRIVITVVPQTAEYNYGAQPTVTWVAGTDYYVTGMQGDDELATVFKDGKLPAFVVKKYVDGEETAITSYDKGTYALEYAENVELANPTRYAGGIQVINGTLEITARTLTGVVAPQTILVNGEIDETAFEIKDGETVLDADALELNAKLAINGKSEPGPFDDGILLTIDNDNFVLAEGTEYGKLTILSTTDLLLNPDETAATKIAVAATAETADGDPVQFNVHLGDDFPTMKPGEWYTMVLPFEVNTLDLVTKLQSYLIVNRLGESTAEHVQFVLESDVIPAGEPFLIKCNKEATFAGKEFKAVTITDEIEDYSDAKYAGNALVGSYAEQEFQSTDDQMLAWLGNSGIKKADGTPRQNKWYEPYSAAKTIAPFEAYLQYAPGKTAGARLVTFQEADGTITAIGTITNDVDARVAEGWYTINGMKLNAAPTQKGVYIQNGKKVIIK